MRLITFSVRKGINEKFEYSVQNLKIYDLVKTILFIFIQLNFFNRY
jgi:hypothetical protein